LKQQEVVEASSDLFLRLLHDTSGSRNHMFCSSVLFTNQSGLLQMANITPHVVVLRVQRALLKLDERAPRTAALLVLKPLLVLLLGLRDTLWLL
jgi:hypothetical protein